MTTAETHLRGAIEELRDTFVRHANAGEAERLVAEFYSEDASFLPPDAPPVRRRSAIRAAIQEMLDAGVGELSIETVEIDGAGEFAYHIGTFRMGKPVPETGKFLEVYRRQPDGSWRCIADIFNGVQFVG
jgi:ketosteroid isomerase-like protein